MALHLNVDGRVLNWLCTGGVDSTGYFNGGCEGRDCSVVPGQTC